MTNFFAPCSRFGTPDELKDDWDVTGPLVSFDPCSPTKDLMLNNYVS